MRRLILVVAVVLSMIVPFVPMDSAEAFPGRGTHQGFFWGVTDTFGDDVIAGGLFPAGPNYADNFINTIINYANGPFGQNRTGADFIILTMLGYPAGTGPWVADDPAVRADWIARVRYYDSQNWVNWNDSQASNENTFWQGNGGGGTEPNDDAWYFEFTSSPTITFHQPGGGWYIIRKECGNPLGGMNGLVPANFDVSVSANRSGSPYTVVAGKTYKLGADLFNNGPANSPGGTLLVALPGGVVRPCAVSCPLPYVTEVGPQPWPQGQDDMYFGYGPKGGFQFGDRWSWSVGPMCAGCGTGTRMSFTVDPATPVGTTITFGVGYSPFDLSGAWRWTTISYLVVSERMPAVTGSNSDIHAGGGVCRQTTQDGFVKGYPGGASMGEYVVSASAANGINDFKTNGTGPDSLKLGSSPTSGSYARVCRPDLVLAALNYRNAGVGFNTWGASDFDVTGKSGVYFLDAAVTTIHGTISQKLTLVSQTGKIVISGPIQIDGVSRPPRSVPSLGVIAGGDIEIAAAVTRVDAYLFSNGTIDTCREANIACSTPTLVINGFLMAQELALHRLGPLNTNGTPVAERVTMNPQIYLNPPRLMDASVDDTLLSGQGERQPLF